VNIWNSLPSYVISAETELICVAINGPLYV